MRVLVTGASGHVAAAVIPELLSHGHQVGAGAREPPDALFVDVARSGVPNSVTNRHFCCRAEPGGIS